MQIYNTLTRKKEEFVPRNGKKVQMFVCGPTVYDSSHLGHARTYIFYDVFAKYLKYKGYNVFYLQNVTDIDDKIIERAKREDKKPLELSKEIANLHFEDMKSLGIDSVDKYAFASHYIPQIIDQIRRLLDKGYAYIIENDGIYFDLNKFADYGKLSGRKTEEAEDAVSRIDESVNKRNKGDFALWKFTQPNSNEPSWDSEFGAGRPGWHIEDTAITETEFGPQYDIHGGALELIFPHHEAEVAQMEAISDKSPLVKYWVHTGLLTIDGKKMSKSLGNFVTIKDLLKENSLETIRLMLLSSHYRSPMDYNEQLLEQSKARIKRIYDFVESLLIAHLEGSVHSKISNICQKTIKSMNEAMDDDFNVPRAFATLFEMITMINPDIVADQLTSGDDDEIKKTLDKFNDLFGIIPEVTEYLPPGIKSIVDEREKVKLNKDYTKSDKLREELKELGYEVKDTSRGQLIKKL